jgi:hypothetical protein
MTVPSPSKRPRSTRIEVLDHDHEHVARVHNDLPFTVELLARELRLVVNADDLAYARWAQKDVRSIDGDLVLGRRALLTDSRQRPWRD